MLSIVALASAIDVIRVSEYHYSPHCPQKENRCGGAPSTQRQGKKPPNWPYSPIATGTPVEVRSPPKLAPAGPAPGENSFPTTLELGGHFAATQSESVVALDTGATANLVCYKWSGNRNSFRGRIIRFGKGGSLCSAIQVWGREDRRSGARSGYQGWQRGLRGHLLSLCA